MLQTEIIFEKLPLPKCTYPPPPYHFKGNGIALIYEIPFERVRGTIPGIYDPDPGKGKIWLKTNIYDWLEFYSLKEPETKCRYYESCYKFSIKYSSEIGDYPIKLYLDHDVPILSGIELYGLQKFRAAISAEQEGTEKHFLIERNGQTELETRLNKAKGIAAWVTTFFANAGTGSYLKKYVGNILYQEEDGREKVLYTPTRIAHIKYELAKPSKIYLREPLEWGILTEAEMRNPKYSFIITALEAELDPPRTIFI